MELPAVILAGGAARRLGGACKPDLDLSGTRLLDHVLEALRAARAELGCAGETVVVAPPEVRVPEGITRVLEDPPRGGPLAGLTAGLDALTRDTPFVAALACDAPRAPEALPNLVRRLIDAPRTDGAIALDPDGREQYLLGIYRCAALAARREQWEAEVGALRGGSLRRFVAPLSLVRLELPHALTHDIDTPADLDAAAGSLGSS
ncbi:MAG: molybdenum cofactor guanylyltransferase [Bowdeniella nasicola]|nr:molybdenum cofactor guanylyltransferase [Bowdeniella nasicola]